MKCWNTMPMPTLIASVGEREADRLAVDGDGALVGLLHAVEDLHQRRLAGAVLADEGVDGAGRMVMLMSWLATTPGNRLVIPAHLEPPPLAVGLVGVLRHRGHRHSCSVCPTRSRAGTGSRQASGPIRTLPRRPGPEPAP